MQEHFGNNCVFYMLSFCVCLEITQSLTVCLQYFVLLLLCFEDCLEDPFRRVQTVLSSKRGFFREAFDTVHFYIAIIYCIYIPTKCTYTVEYIYIVYQIHKTRVLLEDGAVCAETCRRDLVTNIIYYQVSYPHCCTVHFVESL